MDGGGLSYRQDKGSGTSPPSFLFQMDNCPTHVVTDRRGVLIILIPLQLQCDVRRNLAYIHRA
jgi:hypothetical protein